MPLHRPTYLVETDPTAEPITVVVGSGDMMRAELEAKRLNVSELPFHITALWLWSALVRAGLEDRPAGQFIADPPEWEPVKDRATGEAATTPLDPTQLAPGETASGAPPSTVPQVSG